MAERYMTQYSPPLIIKLPLPCEIPRGKGISKTSGYGGNLRVRCTDAEYDLIEHEASTLGITIANFCRHLAINGAKALRKHREEESKSYEVEIEQNVNADP
jgi:hypothetical protein